MKRITLTLAPIAALVMTAGVATAQSEMDTDGDGMVSFSELVASYPEVSEDTFVALDSNGDGALDNDELASAQEAGVLPASDG